MAKISDNNNNNNNNNNKSNNNNNNNKNSVAESPPDFAVELFNLPSRIYLLLFILLLL